MSDPNQKYDNRGRLFPAGEKRTDNSPDYWGSATVNGKRMKISGWKQKNEKGMFLSLAFREDDSSQPQPKPDSSAAPKAAEDLPF